MAISAKKNMGVIFDLDGVLIDTGPFHKQSWFDLAKLENFEMTDELFYHTFGMQNYQILPILLKRQLSQSEIDRMADWKEAHYRELITGQLNPIDGVLNILKDLKAKGFRIAVGTSAPQANLDLVLKGTGLGEFFDAYVVGEHVKRSKPAPDTFLEAAKRLSLDPAQCVVVEDAVVGVQAGKSAGMSVVAVTNSTSRQNLTNAKADRVVDSLAELNACDFKKLIDN